MGTMTRTFKEPADFTFYMNQFAEFRVSQVPEDAQYELQQVFHEEEPGGINRFTYVAQGLANMLFVEAYVPEKDFTEVVRALKESGYILNSGSCSLNEFR